MTKESLSSFQNIFSKAVLDSQNDYGLVDTMSNETIRMKRLDVYRNNVVFSLIESLQDLYPVVVALIGEQAFSFLAKQYALNNLPQRGTLIGYSASFADYLDDCINTHDTLQQVPYIADIARLEYCLHSAYHAADLPHLLPEAVSRIDQNSIVKAQLQLHPSVALLHSRWPIVAIWEAHQHSELEASHTALSHIDLDADDHYVMVIRIHHALEVRSLQSGDWCFLQCMQSSENTETAMMKATEKDVTFSLTRIFETMLFDGTFTGIHTP